MDDQTKQLLEELYSLKMENIILEKAVENMKGKKVSVSKIILLEKSD